MEITTNLKKSKKKGFTLIELIIVIAIIGIIALIAIPKFTGAQKEAKINADIASAKTIANAAAVALTKKDTSAITEETNQTVEAALGGDVKKQLQSIPKPKAVNGDFNITINTEGDITVFAGETGEGKSNYQVYPRVDKTSDANNPYAE